MFGGVLKLFFSPIFLSKSHPFSDSWSYCVTVEQVRKLRRGLDLTYLLKVFFEIFDVHNIVERCFVSLCCLFSFFDFLFKNIPLNARSKKFVLSKNVVTFLVQESKLSLYI